jgi:carbamoyltransferase
MTAVIKFLDNRINEVPAVVHLDGTGRLQTVTENDNLWFYNLLKLFMKKTNVPIILNTSFNDREPIVETPQDALGCFLRTDIDFLYFRDGNILVSKKNEDE